MVISIFKNDSHALLDLFWHLYWHLNYFGFMVLLGLQNNHFYFLGFGLENHEKSVN